MNNPALPHGLDRGLTVPAPLNASEKGEKNFSG
jgi:hypothetical protein